MVQSDLVLPETGERTSFARQELDQGVTTGFVPRSMPAVEPRQLAHEARDLIAVGYRSERSQILTDAALTDMLAAARRKNAALGISGLLVVKGDQIIQWLEGPEHAVDLMMATIMRDDRHRSISVLERRRVKERFFGPWTMVMASDRDVRAPKPVASVVAPASLLEQLDAEEDRLLPFFKGRAKQFWPAPHVRPRGETSVCSAPLGLGDVVATRIDPALRQGLQANGNQSTDGTSWTLAGAGLKRLVLEGSDQAVTHFIRRMTEGRDDPIGDQVALIEETARQLGNSVAEESCSEAEVLLGLSNIVMSLRQLNNGAPAALAAPAEAPTVLVTTRPGERQFLSAVLAAEYLWQRGWTPQVLFPVTEAELLAEVARKSFAAIHVALSTDNPALDKPTALEHLISLARSKSRNEAVVVTLGGRVMNDAPERAGCLGADGIAGSVAALDDILRSVIPASAG